MQAARGGQVVVDDVAELPVAARPRVGKRRRRLVIGKAAAAGELIGRDRDRRGDANARRFGEQRDRVVAERRRVLVAGPVVVVERVLQHAGAPVLLERERHGVAQQAGRAPDQRVVVAIDRIGVGRHEEARPARPHLVHRQEHLRMPAPIEEVRDAAALGQVHHERIAVDVVADVLVVQPGKVGAFELGALPLAIPVHGDRVAVGIERREDDHDRRVQRSRDLGIVGRGEQVQQLGRRLRAANLGGVNAHADRHDHRLLVDDGGGGLIVERPRIGQAKRVGANLIEARDVVGRRDDRGDELAAFGGRTGIDELDAIGRGGDGFEIALQRRPVGELAIGAHPEAERGLRCLDGRPAPARRHSRKGSRGAAVTAGRIGRIVQQ